MLRIIPDRVAFALLPYSPFLLDITWRNLAIHLLECPHWVAIPLTLFASSPFSITNLFNVISRRHERFIPPSGLHFMQLSISFHLAFGPLPRTRSFSNGLYSNHSTAPRPCQTFFFL